MRNAIFIILCLLSSASLAKNIGNYGQVFPVIEEDIRRVIMSRLKSLEKSGELARHQEIIQKRVAEHIVRPTPLALSTTESPVVFRVDPTIKVSHDIYTPDGLLVAKEGMRVNPFEHIRLSKTLFFFNGDDKHQVAWVKKHYQDYAHVKFILTGGSIQEAAEEFGRIYFDLNGQLTHQLQIQHVPSVVNQEGLFWQVKEIGVNDD